MRFLIFRAAGLLFSPAASFALALPPSDYARPLRESPAFARADKRLNDAWRILRAELPPERFQAVRAEQRLWLQQRDTGVEAARASGDARPEETLQRATFLEVLAAKPAALDSPPRQFGELVGTYGKGAVTLQEADDGRLAALRTAASDGSWVCVCRHGAGGRRHSGSERGSRRPDHSCPGARERPGHRAGTEPGPRNLELLRRGRRHLRDL